MRGKVEWRGFFLRHFLITPAYAGKSQPVWHRFQLGQDHPRVCGEKMPKQTNGSRPAGSPPRMRGKVRPLGIIAGHLGDHPRVCGEKRFSSSKRSGSLGSPPRMRGKVCALMIATLLRGITPAYAGKRSASRFAGTVLWDHPRVCGEKPDRILWEHWKEGSPPRMRGKEGDVDAGILVGGITPAYAGKRSSKACRMGAASDHPRVCGEKCSTCFAVWAVWGSPPRMRGKAATIIQHSSGIGITPAYAGKSDTPSIPQTRGLDHPRVCGEKVYKDIHHVAAMGSPPRMRGKVQRSLFVSVSLWITPAYAGKRPRQRGSTSRQRDHPRVCGEKPTPSHPSGVREGSPPRMRGKVDDIETGDLIHGITPAYAGKSGPFTAFEELFEDHPRVCGEKGSFTSSALYALGSPPRMRGKEIWQCKSFASARITPAYAGKSVGQLQILHG